MATYVIPERTVGEKSLQVLALSLSGATLALLFVGAMVTSTNSGLSVPDWPTTFGHNMFAYPLRDMKGGIFYEHGHRLFASAVGLLTIAVAVSAWMWDRRRWVQWLSLAALIMVCAQGVLGGLTVRHKLPIAVSSAHAGLAAVFFCTTLWLASVTTRAWSAATSWNTNTLTFFSGAVAVFSLMQTLLGAAMRHSYAGLAIPTFPRAFGDWVPSFWSQGIVLNFLHTRIGAGMLTMACLALAFLLLRAGKRGWGVGLIVAVGVQLLLGMLTIWSGRLPLMASLHLAGGALLLGILFLSALWAGKHSAAVTA